MKTRINAKMTGFIFAAFCALFFSACKNFFHDLVPPDGNQILSFNVPGQIGEAVIGENTIIVTVSKGTAIHELYPEVTISGKASLFPITPYYIQAAFPQANIVREALALARATDLTSYAHDLIQRNPDFNVPALDIPIDFSGPVYFFVISGQGNTRQYTINVVEDSGEPRLLGFRFSKYENSELVNDAFCMVDERSRSINTLATYPAEMPSLTYALVPSFEILGDSLEVGGINIQSGVTDIQFATSMGSQTKTITVTRGGISIDYTLNVLFAEDPNTIRSITDFRFNKTDNPSIAATAVASIVNNGDTGTINIQVFYSGANVTTLKPRYITPGVARVSGIVQTTGINSHDFSAPVQYNVVSKNGMYTRTYTVRTEFINLYTDAPRITSFTFSQTHNPDLIRDSAGEIGDGLIMIDVHYSNATAPEIIIPEFSAEGLVTVYSSVQVSGSSGQNYSRQVKYTVTNPENPVLTRDYWVQTRFVRDTSSDAAIYAFGFYPEDNPGLADVITGKIVQDNITLYAPVGSGVTGRIMVPRFTAAGQVSVAGVIQSSGVSGLLFDQIITYTVVSANGLYSRTYNVNVRELKSTIFVNSRATGLNDGASWQDAFTNLKDACEAAALFPEDTPREIWIAEGTYKPSNTLDRMEYFPLTPNTSYIGCFDGTETAKSQRNIAAHPVVISGNLGGGVYSNNLFVGYDTTHFLPTINGDVSFYDLKFTSARASNGTNTSAGAAILIRQNSTSHFIMDNCVFNDFESYGSGGAIYLSGGIVEISNTTIEDSKTNGEGGAIWLQGDSGQLNSLTIKNCSSGGSGGGILSWMPLTISGLLIDSTTAVGAGGGIRCLNSITISGTPSIIKNTKSNGSGGAIYFENNGTCSISGLTIDTVSGSNSILVSASNLVISGAPTVIKNITGAAIYISSGTNTYIDGLLIQDVTMTASGNNFDYGAITIVQPITGFGTVQINNTEIYNVSAIGTNNASAINFHYLTSPNVIIDNVIIDGVSKGSGISVNYFYDSGSMQITNSLIQNCTTGNNNNGGGICLTAMTPGTGQLVTAIISDVIIKNSTAYFGGGIYIRNSSAGSVINNCEFVNTSSTVGNVGNCITLRIPTNVTLTGNNYNGIPNPVEYLNY